MKITTNEPLYAAEDMISAAADLFDDPQGVLTEYGNGVVQLIGNLLGLTTDHFELVLLLIQKEVRVQTLISEKNSLAGRIDILTTENNLLKAEITRANEEIRELV